MASFIKSSSRNSTLISKKDELPPESLSDYYEERKKIIFEKQDINNKENALLNLLKKSQQIVNDRCSKCMKGGFFQSLPSNIFNLSNSVKENIANYCLIFSLYFNAGENIKALKIFLLMCEQNKSSIIYLTSKIIEQLPKISNTNKIAKFYPTITKTMLQILGIFIKLSGRFNKSTLEEFYITLYLKIVHVLSITVIKYNPANNDEMNNQLKNERRYFYSSCLFDSSIYLLNRFQPLSTIIYILQHILELYGNKLTFVPNEIESILLLKVNYNLGLFCYINDNYKESINNLNQAKIRLLEIKYFPITKNFRKKNNENKELNKLCFISNNSSSNLYNFNDLLEDFKQNEKFSRNKFIRSSINTNTFSHNEQNKLDKETLISKIKEKNLKTQREYELQRDNKIKPYTTLYLSANSLLSFQAPILLEIVKEKIFIEIELLLSEIELNHKNYRESLNHINTILKLQSIKLLGLNSESIEKTNSNDSKLITKSKTVNNILFKNSMSSNGKAISEESKISENNKLSLNLKNKNLSETYVLTTDRKKNENINSYNIFSKFKNFKYRLSNIDKNRIMLILEKIEIGNSNEQNNTSDNKMNINYTKKLMRKNKSLNKEGKMISSKEMEKFFIFICNLSLYQLKILNESQPEPSQRRNDLPIIFSNQFQDCLTNSQRMSLSLLETMSLSRYIILKDTNKDISPENLDYRFMKYRIKEDDLEEGNSYKYKNKTFLCDIIKERRKSSDSNMSIKTQNNLGSKKFVCFKNNDYEFEKLRNIDMLINNIMNEKNKNFIDKHKKSILKLLNQVSKEEFQIFLKCPKLLRLLINNISKKYEIKEKGEENDNNKNISNLLFGNEK